MLQSCVVAVVVPDVDVIKCWATENNIPGTLSVLCNNSQVKQLILEDMLSWGREAGLKSFEQVRKNLISVMMASVVIHTCEEFILTLCIYSFTGERHIPPSGSLLCSESSSNTNT